MKKKRAPIPIHVQWILDNTDVNMQDKSPEGEEYFFSLLYFGMLFLLTKERVPTSLDEFIDWLDTMKFTCMN